jgi:hypothetical protein
MSLAKNIVWLAASAIPSFGLDSVCLGSDTLGGVELIPSVSVVCSSYPILEHAFAMSQAWQVDNYSVNCKAATAYKIIVTDRWKQSRVK